MRVQGSLMRGLLVIALLLGYSSADATEWVTVENASQLRWQINQAGVVYFRNIDQFDTNQTGCCYAYKLDTTTEAGKSLWATLLSRIAAGQTVVLGFPMIGSNQSPATLIYVGHH